MGCHSSKLNGGGGEVLPARMRLLLRHKIEEVRKRKNGGSLRGEDRGSMKQLLKDDEPETEDKISTPRKQTVVEKLSKVVPLPVSESGAEEHGEDGEKNDEEEDGRFIGPGSPSFKIYCKKEEEEKEEESGENENETIGVHQKTPSADSVESDGSASANSTISNNEVVEITEPIIPKRRRGHKIRKFGAMKKKNLLHVKNLHKTRINPLMACTGNHKARLLSDR